MAGRGRATNEPLNYIGFSPQTSGLGTEGAAGDFVFFKYLNGSGFEIDQQITSEREGGDGQEVGNRYKTFVSADGSLNTRSRPNAITYQAAWTLGAQTVPTVIASGTLGPVYQTFITPAATLTYLTEEQRHGDIIERTSNVVFTSLTIEGEKGQPLSITNETVSGGSVYRRAVASTLTATFESTDPHYYPGGSYVLNGVGGTSDEMVKWRIQARRNVDTDIQTTGLSRQDVVPLNQDYDFDCTLKLSSPTLYQYVNFNDLAGTQINIPIPTSSFKAYCPNGSYPLEIGIPVMDLITARVNKLDPDGQTVYLDIAGMTQKGATNAIYVKTLSTVSTTVIF